MEPIRLGGAVNRSPAGNPEELGRLFLERANAGDVEGVVALYEPGAVLAFPAGQVSRGSPSIRRVYQQLLSTRPTFTGEVQPALLGGDLALTSTRFEALVPRPDGGTNRVATATGEIARRQPDGSWLWVVDQPNILA